MSKSYRLCEREQIILIDGYKMLRMELEAQPAWMLEWNGVHSWVTSLFQWCSKRRINPPHSLWKKKKSTTSGLWWRLIQDNRQRRWRLTYIQYTRKSNHKYAPGALTTENTCLFKKILTTPLTFTFYLQSRYHYNIKEVAKLSLANLTFQGDFLHLRPKETE